MTTQKTDYYEVLGIERNASQDDIKRAFRRLAMQYHPDRNSEASAEARFKEINEAYEVLSDPERRATYDRFGHAGLNSDFGSRGFEGFGPFGGFGDIFDAFFGAANGSRRRAPSRGADIQVQVELTFEEAAFGAEKSVVVNRTELCSKCNGLRAEAGTEPLRCPTCEGAGEVRHVQRSVFGQFINAVTCDRCRGEGWIIQTPCSHCRGTGRERITRTLQVKVPAGIDNGSQIRLTGEGEIGANGGPHGSLYVAIRIAPHSIFERVEDDLHVQVNINFIQAALGDELEVPTLEGNHKLKVAAGTESGDVLTLRNRGVAHLRSNGRGDLMYHVQVTTPKKLNSEQKKLLQRLGETLSEDQSAKNIFEKVKDAFS